MQLKDLYECLSLVWIEGKDILKYIEDKKNQQELEILSKDVFKVNVILNYYLDKRQRNIQRLFVFFNEVSQSNDQPRKDPALLLGFFTPDNIEFVDKDTEKKFINPKLELKFKQKLREKLPDYISLYNIEIFTQNTYPQIRLGNIIT